MASPHPPVTPPPPPPPAAPSHSSPAVYEDIRIHFPRLLQQSSTPDLSAAALAAADMPLPPSPSVSTHRLLHPSSAAHHGQYHSLHNGGHGSPSPSFRGLAHSLPRRPSAASGDSQPLPLFAAATARASSALASTIPSLLHRRAVVGLIVADLVMSVGVFAAIAANAAVSPAPDSSLWSRLVPTVDLAIVNLVRGLALVWLVVKGWLPVSPTTLTMATSLYAAGKAMALLTSPSPVAPTSLAALYTCYSLVIPLVESLHLRAALASFASRRSSVTPSTMTPPTPIRASTMPSSSTAASEGGPSSRYASHRSTRRSQRPPVTTATFASGAGRPLLDEADSRDYRTFLGAPPTAKQVARAAQRRDSVGPGESDLTASQLALPQQQQQQHQQQQSQPDQQPILGSSVRRLMRRPWFSDIIAGITGQRSTATSIPQPPPPPRPSSFLHDDWGRSRSHSHSGALLSPRSQALTLGSSMHPTPAVHQYTSLADPPLQRSRRPPSGGHLHPPSLNPARWSLATFDSADLARLSSAVQPWLLHGSTSSDSMLPNTAPQPSLRHPPGMSAPVNAAAMTGAAHDDDQPTMRAVGTRSLTSSSTYDSDNDDDDEDDEARLAAHRASLTSSPPPVPMYQHRHHHHARPHRGEAQEHAARYKRNQPAPLTPHFRSMSMGHLGTSNVPGASSAGYYGVGEQGEVVISPLRASRNRGQGDMGGNAAHSLLNPAATTAAAAAPGGEPTVPVLSINTNPHLLASPPTPSASHSNPSTAPPTPFGTYAAAQKLARPAEASFRSGAATLGGDSRTLASQGTAPFAHRHGGRGHVRNRSSASMAAMASSDDGAGGDPQTGVVAGEYSGSYDYVSPDHFGAGHGGAYHHRQHHRFSSYSQHSSGVGDEEDEVSSSDRGGVSGRLGMGRPGIHRSSAYGYGDDYEYDDDEPPGSAKDTATVYSALSAHLYRPPPASASGYYQGGHPSAFHDPAAASISGEMSSRSGSGHQSPLSAYPPHPQDLVALAVDSGAGTGSAGPGAWMAAGASTMSSGRHLGMHSPGTLGARSFVTAPSSASMSIGTFRGGVPPPPPPPPPPLSMHPGVAAGQPVHHPQQGAASVAFRKLSESLKRALYGAEIQFAFASSSSSASRKDFESAITNVARDCRVALDDHPLPLSQDGVADDAVATWAQVQLVLVACHLYLAALASVPMPSDLTHVTSAVWSSHWWIAARTLAHVDQSLSSSELAASVHGWHALVDWVHALVTRSGKMAVPVPTWMENDSVWCLRRTLLGAIVTGTHSG